MSMITQAFRYAYEPFVFGKARDKDNKETYARAMKFFIIFTLLAFLVVMGYMDILRHIIGRDYWVGLKVVPIVMAGGIMTGVYFNLSFWYKLIDKTIWGCLFLRYRMCCNHRSQRDFRTKIWLYRFVLGQVSWVMQRQWCSLILSVSVSIR